MLEFCEVCKGKGQKVLVVVICIDCRQFFCLVCRDVYWMFCFMKDYKYVDFVVELFDEKFKVDDKLKLFFVVNR